MIKQILKVYILKLFLGGMIELNSPLGRITLLLLNGDPVVLPFLKILLAGAGVLDASTLATALPLV